VFKFGKHGKPTLTKPAVEIPFNLCHTGNVALVGISGGGRVGIDAEALRPDVEIEALSGQLFAPPEAAEIRALPPDERVAAFFTCWCRKEAFVKALGSGLSMPLNRFQVSVKEGETVRLLWADGEDVNNWSLFDISEPGTAAALIIEGPVKVLRRFDFVASP
jgi:4'-phosphopantetheinyl transferase